ncbi:MAG: DNA primase [Patescibacteria group bacterium]|nr:DNA primase [Patescibacteria group bacterium]
MNSPVEEIKNRIDIVDFLRFYVELKPAGKNFKARCPFHNEKTPSFMVSPERQTWHCFGSCSEGGDIFKFLMKFENIEFYEALKILAEKAGVELKKISPSDQKQFGILYDINETAKDYFKQRLAQNERPQKYLDERKLKKETIEEFEIGFAPQAYDELTLYLVNLGYDVKDIERAGLNFKSERGNYLDRFRGRIMFPIYNHFGKTVGFSGRILPELDNGEMGKYINSPETPIFNKSKILYGFHKSKNFIREEKNVFLVEGQMDFLMCWQDGIKNAAATSGTALTGDHLKALKRIADNLIFSFDNDEAGLKAAERAIDLANNMDFNVKVLPLKEFKDPAEAVMKKPSFLKSIIKEAKLAMEFYFDAYLKKNESGDFSDDKKNIRAVLAKVKNISSPIERAHWLSELGHKVNIDEKILAEEMNQIKLAPEGQTLNEENFKKINIQTVAGKNRVDMIAKRLIILTLAIGQKLSDEKKCRLFGNLKESIQYLPEKYKEIFELTANEKTSDKPEILNLMESLSLQSSMEIEKLKSDDKAEREFLELLKQLEFEYLKNESEKTAKKIKEAEKKDDKENLEIALKQFDKISKLLHNKQES